MLRRSRPSSLPTNARSMIRIVFDSTSLPSAGAISPVNRLPGERHDHVLDRADLFHPLPPFRVRATAGSRNPMLQSRLERTPEDRRTMSAVDDRATRRRRLEPRPSARGSSSSALIMVAAVANLNLSVANVALPEIGEAFDSSQVTLNLIAVGYSLGLAASVLYLGALGDRYGRKMMLVLGTALAIPMSLLAAFAPSRRSAVRRARGRRARGRNGLPDDAGADHRAVVRPGSHEVDRALVGARWRDRRARAARLGRAARAVRVGIGLPHHAAARGRRPRHGIPVRTEPRERDERARRQPRRHPLRRPRRGAHPRDQLRAGPERDALSSSGSR